MAYWLDEAWHRWPQIDEVGTAAAGLYSRCGAYIADEGTDGFIPTARARMYGTLEWIQRLVEVGLWVVEEKGFRDVRYLELNATKAQLEERKKQAASRQARYQDRTKRRQRVTDASDHTSNDASLTRSPFPSPLRGKGRGGAQGAPPPRLPDPPWCGRCHRDTRRTIDDEDRPINCPNCHPDLNRSVPPWPPGSRVLGALPDDQRTDWS